MNQSQRAKDIMATPVIAARHDTNLHDAEELLKKNRITGMPVLNEKDEIIGILSEKHLLSIYDIRSEEDITDLSFRLPYEYKTWVEEIMTKEVIAVDEDTAIEDICRLMLENHIHRVPVLRDKKVVGMISSLSLVGYLLKMIEEEKSE